MEHSKSNGNLWPFLSAAAVLVILSAAIVWSHAHPFGIHWDEAEYLDQVGVDVQRLWAGRILTLGGRILIKTLGKPPAYRLLVLPFLAVFGFHAMVARLVSLACFALSSWFVYLATCRIGGRVAGAIAVFIFALSPEIVSASVFFGTDTSLYLATSAMLYYVFMAWSNDSKKSNHWIGLGLAVGLGFLAKTSFLLIATPVLALWLVMGYYGWLGVPSLRSQTKAAALAFVLAAPWWALNVKKSFAYAQYARGFVRNSLGSPSPATWMRWLNTVIQGLLGHGISILAALVLIAVLVKVLIRKETLLNPLQKAALVACACAGLPIVLAQLAGTNHLLRHISPSMIPLAISVGLLAETSGWIGSWLGAATTAILVCGQMAMLLFPVVVPNNHPVDLAFPNGVVPWQALVRFDQWDWTPVRNLGHDCGLDAPKISYLGNGRAFDIPQIQYSWIAQRLPEPEVIWLWRYEDGPLDWQKIMDSADQSDIVITAPGFVGESKIKENLDNQYNTGFSDRLSHDPHFGPPVRLAMGRFEPVEVQVFVKSTLACHSEPASTTR